jgi:hypothetical protein
MEQKNIRKPVYAGSFYPEDAETLRFVIKQYIDAADTDLGRCNLKAIISPHAGYVYSGYTAGYSYKTLRQFVQDKNQAFKVFLIGPAHKLPVKHFALASYDSWHTPLGEIKVSDVADELVQEDYCDIYDQAHIDEHSLEVQLPFLQSAMSGKSFEIIPMLCSKPAPEDFTQVFDKYLDDNSIIVVSTDLSHYLSYDQANSVDERTIEAIKNLDNEKLLKDGDACGLCGVSLLMQLAQMKRWKVEIADYRTSGDTAGSKDAVVGYMSAYFCK